MLRLRSDMLNAATFLLFLRQVARKGVHVAQTVQIRDDQGPDNPCGVVRPLHWMVAQLEGCYRVVHEGNAESVAHVFIRSIIVTARLRSDIFVSALIRRIEAAGAVAMLRRRGAAEAGAIFVTLDRLDGRVALYGPAAQSEADEYGLRTFTRVHQEDWRAAQDIDARLNREIQFDTDIWIVDIEDRAGRNFLHYD